MGIGVPSMPNIPRHQKRKGESGWAARQVDHIRARHTRGKHLALVFLFVSSGQGCKDDLGVDGELRWQRMF